MPKTVQHSTFDADVIIVGAGPIGLTTACALRHHGVDCMVLEERTEPRPYSRANNVWARPQELLESVGIRAALADKSYRITQVNTLLNGQPTSPVELDQVASPYAEVLYSGQDVIETTLSEAVAARGEPVQLGRKVIGVEQDDDGVDVTIVTPSADEAGPDGAPQRLRCRYLVGADGTEGTVRQAVGLDFETQSFEHRMNRQVDARLTWRRSTDTDQLWFFYYKNGFCGVLPVWGGYHRLFFLADDAGVPDRDPTLEEIELVAREVTEDETLTLTDPIWFSHSRFQHGVAPHYAKDRVFLVGDSGHHTLPIGGQGMNAGFHDAIGLSWRLAMTLAGKAGPDVLGSYDGERGGEHARLDEQQAKGFRQAVYRGAVKDAAMDVGAKLLPNIGSLIQGTDDLQQMSVSYSKSALSEDHVTGLREKLRPHVPHPGERAPDADVTDDGGNRVRLMSQIYNPDGRSWGWCLLAFDGRKDDSASDLTVAVREVARWDWVRPRLVLGAPSGSELASCAAVKLFDLDGLAHDAYGVDGLPTLVLIRPDGHIAFRGPADRPDRLNAFCERVFGASRS